ncbi:hypothetical protein B7494_g2560 [Chlorociboria aeruginascens]|nr:hypothetical protein B7494_g2560 [Chlorociboria aeruginascens]
MPQNHRHIRIKGYRLLGGNPDSIHEGRHRASHLAEKVAIFSKFRGSHLTPSQKMALDEYRKDDLYDLASHTKKYPDLQVLGAYFRLFDILFFFGRLKGLCEIVFDPTPADRTGYTSRNIRNKSLLTQITGKKRYNVSIIIYSREKAIPNRTNRLRQYIGTLLYEICHAFFQICACDMDFCKEPLQERGITGHGFTWQDVAYAVEKTVNDKDFLNLGLNLRRGPSFGKELAAIEGQIPKGDLPKWELCVEDVDQWIEHYQAKNKRR